MSASVSILDYRSSDSGTLPEIPWGKLRDTAKSTLSTLLTMTAGGSMPGSKPRAFEISNGDLVLFTGTQGQISTLSGTTGSALTIASGATIADVVQSAADPSSFLTLSSDGKVHRVSADTSQGLSATELYTGVTSDTAKAMTNWRSGSLLWDEDQGILLVTYLAGTSGNPITVEAAAYSVGPSALTLIANDSRATSDTTPAFPGDHDRSVLRLNYDGAAIYAAAASTSGSSRFYGTKITYDGSSVSIGAIGAVTISGAYNQSNRLQVHDDMAQLSQDSVTQQLYLDGSWTAASVSVGYLAASNVILRGAGNGEAIAADGTAAMTALTNGLPMTLEHAGTSGYRTVDAFALSDGSGLALVDTNTSNLRLRTIRTSV